MFMLLKSYHDNLSLTYKSCYNLKALCWKYKKISIFIVIDMRLLFSTIFLKVIREIHFCMPLQTAFEFYQHHAPFIPSSWSPKRLFHHKNNILNINSMHINSVGRRKLFVTLEMSILLQTVHSTHICDHVRICV